MVYTLKSLLNEAGKSTGTPKAVGAVWKALMVCMSDTLKTGKGVRVKGLCSMTSVRTSKRDPKPGLKVRTGSKGRGMELFIARPPLLCCITDPNLLYTPFPLLFLPSLQNHVFFLSPQLSRSYGLTSRRPGPSLLSPCIESNTSKMVVLTGLDKDTVVGSMKALVTKLGEFMGSGDAVKIPFGELGVLYSEGRKVSFKFNTDGIGAPNMVKSILTQSMAEGGETSEINSWVDHFMTKKRKEEEEAAAAVRAMEEEADQTVLIEDLALTSNQVDSARVEELPLMPKPTSRPMTSAALPSSRPIIQPPKTAKGSTRAGRTWKDSLASGRESYSTKKEKLEEMMSTHPFPKFLIPTQKNLFKGDTPAVTRNMEIAYERLEKSLEGKKAAKTKQLEEIKALQDLAFKDYMGRKEKEKRLRAEITASLDAQSAFDRARKAETKEREKREMVVKSDCRAYPMAKPLDLQMEYLHKKNLRESLELQVHTRSEAERLKRIADNDRERARLASLHDDLRREREDKLRGTLGGHVEMARQWEKQISIARRLREVG